MKVKGQLEGAQLELKTTAEIAALTGQEKGMIYFDHEAGAIVIHNGTSFVKNIHPVGTVFTSMLDEATFQTEMDDTWVLADGAAQACYLTDTLGVAIPNLCGQFLRGKDNGEGNNPDGELDLGEEQSDAVGKHAHDLRSGQINMAVVSGERLQGYTNGAPDTHMASNADSACRTTGYLINQDETRPKNVTVNYFIKINK